MLARSTRHQDMNILGTGGHVIVVVDQGPVHVGVAFLVFRRNTGDVHGGTVIQVLLYIGNGIAVPMYGLGMFRAQRDDDGRVAIYRIGAGLADGA